MSATEETDDEQRALLGLTWLVGKLGAALNGRYRSRFTGDVITISDADDVLHKTVTTAYGERRQESVRDVCQVIDAKLYVRLES